MKYSLMVLGVLTLAACSPSVPDSGAPSGVGFDGYGDYTSYRSARDAELAGRRPAANLAPAPVATAPITSGPIASGPVATAPGTDVAAAAPVDPNNARISDEQDFNAVSNRQSIESDAERLRRQREAYQVIEPTAVPRRAGNGGPNIVAFALSNNNPVGRKLYRRSVIGASSKFQRNCAKYNSNDQAQEAFLAAGGPDRDKSGMDPDGDGFACGWDPTPFRQLRS